MDFEKFFSFLGKENTTTPEKLKAIMDEAKLGLSSSSPGVDLEESPKIDLDELERNYEEKSAVKSQSDFESEHKASEVESATAGEVSEIDKILSEFDNPLPTYEEMKKLTLPEGTFEEGKEKTEEVPESHELSGEEFATTEKPEEEVKEGVGGEDLSSLIGEFKVEGPQESVEVSLDKIGEFFGGAAEGEGEEKGGIPSAKEKSEESFFAETTPTPSESKGVEEFVFPTEEGKSEESFSFGEGETEEFIKGMESAEEIETPEEVPIESFSEEVSFGEVPKETPPEEVTFPEEVKSEEVAFEEKVTPSEGGRYESTEAYVSEVEELPSSDYIRALEILKGYPPQIRKAVKDLIKNGLISESQVNTLFKSILSNPSVQEIENLILSLAPFYRFEEVPSRKVIVAAERSKVDEFFEKAFKKTVVVGVVVGVLSIVGIIVFNAVSRYIYSDNLYKKGLVLIDSSYYEEAENLFKRAESVSGRDKYWYNTYAKRYIYNNAPDWAVNKLETALKYWPYDYETSLNYVDALLKLDPPNFDKALQYSQDFRRAMGDSFKGIDLNAQVYVKYGDYTKNPEYYREAERLYMKFLKAKDNKHISSLFRLVSIYTRLDDKSKVDEIYNYIRAIDKKAIVEDVEVELARYYIDKDDLSMAKKVLFELSTISPKNPDFYYEFARYLYKMENFSESKKKLLEALKINPKHAKSYALMGDIALLSGKDPEAIENYQKSLSFDPDLVEPYYKLGDIFYNKDDFTTALGYYLSGLSKGEVEDKKYFSEVNYRIAKIYYMNGVNSESIKYLSRAYVLDPYNPLISQFMGNIYLEMKKPDLALVQFSKSIDVYTKILDSIKVINPKIVRHLEIVSLAARAYNNMGVSYVMMGRTEDNIKDAVLKWEEARVLAQNINTEYPIAKYNINLVMHPVMSKYSNFVVDKDLPKSIPESLDYYLKQVK